jgi:hypothetical protein
VWSRNRWGEKARCSVRLFFREDVNLSGLGLGGEAVALDVFVGDAPDGASGCGEEEFFNGDAEDVDAEEIGDVVEAMNEIGIEEEKAEEQEKV